MKKAHFLQSLILLVAVVFVFAGVGIVAPRNAEALSGGEFNASRIIDDPVFFNPSTMLPSDIQAFLNAKLPACDTNGTQPYGGTTRGAYGASRGYPPPYTCLKDYVQTIPGVGADAYCGGSIGAGTKTAAQIIYEVGQACGVSQKVLLVLLQKEQGLVTDDWPWSVQYTKATGMGCPDSALGTDVDSNQNGCYDEYEGFFKQIYYGARQYQRYAKQASLFNYKAGQNNYIQYNPNAGCGGSNVVIQNQATAGLYNYTPYQPNAAALANLYGSGDSCSAYGNRNFWRLYNDWFGTTYTTVPFAWSYEGQWAYVDASRTSQFTGVPTVAPNGKFYVRVKARNMGNQTWESSFLNIGVSRPIDRASSYADGTWVSNSRAARLLETSVAPGQIGTFEFAIQAPSTPGTYSEYFNLVAEGRTWLNDLGLIFLFNVTTPGEAAVTNATLSAGQSLARDDFLLSTDRNSVLTLRGDGDLVLYSNGLVPWHTGAFDRTGSRLVMQADGNLVLYNGSGQALWNTETGGNPNARLVLQTDGNLVLYSASNVPLWASYSISVPDNLSYTNITLPTNGRMYPGQVFSTADRRYKLIMQTDGNLVLYSPSRAIWASGTDGKQTAFVAMQSDGNLVLYERGGRPLWYTGTANRPNLRLVIQQDGNLVMYNPTAQAIWNTQTAGAQ